MSNNSIQENFTELQEAVQSYVEARLNYWKVTLIEKVARAGTHLLSTVLLLVSALVLYLLLALSFSFWFAANIGTISQGFLISAGVFVIITLIVYLLRRRIFENGIVKKIASIVYDEED